MEDITPALVEAVTEDFRRSYNKSATVQRLLEQGRQGTATYAEAQEYALEVSRLMQEAYRGNVTTAVLPDGKMYYNIASRLVPATVEADHTLVADYAAAVQKELNEKAGIGLQVQKAPVDADRVDGLVELACSDEYEAVEQQLLTAFETYDQAVVDETIRRNADLHYGAGLSPKIIRRATGKCCAWCREKAGVHRYPVEREIYQRHGNCRCTVLYDPADGSKKVQNVHSRRWTEPKNYDKLKASSSAMAQPGWVKSNYKEKRALKQGFEAFPSGALLKTYIQRVKPDGDFFDVAMHGTPGAVCFGTDAVSMDARELGRIILRDPNYRQKQPIRLLSCSTGVQPDDGSYCVAEQLANFLGVEVKAPNDTLHIRPDGNFYIGLMRDGELASFYPNQRRRIK